VVDDGDGDMAVGAPKERAVLAVLASRAGTTVGVSQLIDALWGEEPPPSAAKAVQTYVSALRRRLPAGAIDTVAGGYRLNVAPESVDVTVFEQLVAAGQQALTAGDPHGAAVSLRRALGLWRGEPLVELAGEPWGAAEAGRLIEGRRVCQELLVEARLATGEAAALVGELEVAVRAEPLRERRWAQLMLALYRAGRQAEALRAFQRLRAQLADQLGIEPSAELRALEEAILLQKPELGQSRFSELANGPAPPVRPGAPLAEELPLARPGSLTGGLVTLLFTDIEGSTRLWERFPTGMTAVLERHDRMVSELIDTEGGQVFKTVGDAIHAVFGSPAAALRAALAVQASVASIAWGEVGRLAVRIGVYTGEAQLVAGEWRGRALNRCARLRDTAAGGQILVSQATVELVGDDLADRAVITDLGQHQLRGVIRSERVHQIHAIVTPDAFGTVAAGTGGVQVAPLIPPPLARAARRTLIGRVAELDRLSRYLSDPGHAGGVVVIAGEAGVGKTRLTAAVASMAADDGALVLYGRCDEGLGAPYQPFAEALGSYVDIAQPQKLAQQLGPSGHELGRVLPGLAERVAGLRAPSSSEPETQRWLLFQATAEFLQAVAGDRRVLLVIDDLHWAEPSTLLLLRHLARADIEGLLVVATTRTAKSDALLEALADVAREHRLHTIPLGGLNHQEVAALLADRLERPADTAFAHATHHQTGGNPFFIHELVSHLSDLGVLPARAGDAAWPTAAQIASSGAPEGVHHVLSRRVALLSRSAREVLELAAVAGEEFYALDVAAAIGLELGTVVAALEETTVAALTTEITRGPGRYRFVHALLRQALYESMSALRRAQSHWQIAESIRGSRAQPERRLSELAYHYHRGLSAADPTVAVRWLQAAGDQAVRQVAFDEAREHYGAALMALDLGADDPDRRYELLAGLGESAAAVSDYEASYPQWLAAAEIARAARDPARFFRAVLGYGTVIRVVEDALMERLILDGLELAGPEDSAERAQFLAWYGAVKWHSWGGDRGPEVGERMIGEALVMARRVNSPAAELKVLFNFERALLGSSRGTEHLATLALAQDLIESAQTFEDKPACLRSQSLVLLQLGRRSEAESVLQEAEALARGRGVHLMLHNILMPRAAIAIAEGRFAEAKSLVAQIRDIGGPHNLTITYAWSAQVSAIRAEEGRADVVIARLEPTSQNPPPGTIAWRVMLAGLLADVGRLEEASGHFEALAPDGFSVVPRDYAFPLALRYLAETCVHLGDTTRAAELLPEAEPYSGQMLIATLGTSIEGAADRSLGQLYGLLGQFDDADRHFEMAWRLEDSMRFPALAARSRYWHARLLVQAQDPNMRVKAVALLQNTQNVTSQLGMALLHQQANNLAKSLHKKGRVRTKTERA
jgi:class 3 adenylate cyclase/DNA-binding SARP family transcriptional activator/tetratricopeptide (TPR) repeat protein